MTEYQTPEITDENRIYLVPNSVAVTSSDDSNNLKHD